ncbi:MAG: hypothetical protein IJF29_06770 [Firmicutes bacterium]|nr:hypothetical protein [Bacillota bacterium]
MLKVGIKFCGGCNPFYERGVVAKKYIADHPEYEFEFVRDENDYDFIIIVCGCMCRCVTYDHLRSKYGFVLVSSEKDFDYVKEKIEEAVNK